MKLNEQLKERRPSLKQPLPKKLLSESCMYKLSDFEFNERTPLLHMIKVGIETKCSMDTKNILKLVFIPF